MNSTNYVLELMISGISNVLWIVLLAFSFWGEEIDYSFIEGRELIISIVLLPIVYVIGIITDRLSDELFEKFFPLRKKYFNDINEHRSALAAVYRNSEALTKLFEYGRMRTRICRNWSVNGIFILITVLIFIWSDSLQIESFSTKIQVSIFSLIILGGSVVAAFYAWKKLNLKEFSFLKLQSKLLSK